MRYVLLVLLAAGLSGQVRSNEEKRLACRDRDRGSDRVPSCKMSEQTLQSLGRLTIESGHNGGVRVQGWSQGQTLVRVRVEAWAPTESEASLLVGQIHIDTAGGTLRSSGPENLNDNRGWAVSWEVFTPRNTDVKASAHNGGIEIADLQGRIDVRAHNGGVQLMRVSGDVTGSTHNGGIRLELAGPQSGPLKLDTHNGEVRLSLPRDHSARVHAETNNGNIRSDFPIPASVTQERRRARNIEFPIGSGGPAIHVKTHNGGVEIRKL